MEKPLDSAGVKDLRLADLKISATLYLMVSLWLAQTTVGTEDEARRLASRTVEAKLAACAQIDGPIISLYPWKEQIETATEWRIVFKTNRARLETLTAFVSREHPYETPEWIAWEAPFVSEAYAQWANDWLVGPDRGPSRPKNT